MDTIDPKMIDNIDLLMLFDLLNEESKWEEFLESDLIQNADEIRSQEMEAKEMDHE